MKYNQFYATLNSNIRNAKTIRTLSFLAKQGKIYTEKQIRIANKKDKKILQNNFKRSLKLIKIKRTKLK